MSTIQYEATVKDSRLLELPEEAQELGLKPGEKVTLTINRDETQDSQVFPPNEKMLAILREIEVRHKDRPFTDGSDTMRLLREARAGAMYGYDPTE